MQTLCYSLGRYLEHIYTYNHTTCRNILSARILWNTCDLLRLGWLGSYSITSKVSNWNQEWFIYIYIHTYIHMHMHMHMHMHVYHVYMYKASPLQIGTHAAIILCAWILQNSPKFLLKSCSIGTWTQTPNMCVHVCSMLYIYIVIFFHVHACTWCTWYIHIIIHIYIYIYIIPTCKHCAIL